MSLEDFFETATIQSWSTKDDGFGGEARAWADGAEIEMGFILDSSDEASVADSQRASNAYTIIAHPDIAVERQDVVRRERDGAFYRILSDFVKTPDVADEQFMVAKAEKIVGDKSAPWL